MSNNLCLGEQGESCSPSHQLAMNAFRSGNKGHASTLPLSEYDRLIAYPWLHEAILQIRGEHKVVGKDMTAAKLKSQLPFRCAHYHHFMDDKRRQDHIDPQAFLFQTSVDIDDKELVDTALEMVKLLDKEDFLKVRTENEGEVANPWKGMLLHLEYSARKKLHIDIRMPVGMTIEETQRAYCDALGVPCDESCFSPERIIFVTDKESEIYRSPHWYEILPDEELRIRREAFLKRGLGIDGRIVKSEERRALEVKSEERRALEMRSEERRGKNSLADSAYNQSNHPNYHACCSQNAAQVVESNAQVVESNAQAVESNTQVVENNAQAVENTAQVADKGLILFDLFRKQTNLDGVDINQEGSRHSSLLAILSAGASRVMSEDEVRRVVAIRMPAFAQEHDCQQLIHDFYAKYGDSSKPFSRDIIRINSQAETMCRKADDVEMEEEYPEPPAMPEKLPKLVELLTSRTPDIYKPAVAHAIFPPLATHLWKTTFRYIDNVEHEATLMCALLAGTGAGKSCVQKPIDLIMADIRKRDQENLAKEKEWKDEVTRKGANKDKRKRPQNLIIQEIDADMTNPAFVMRTAEAQEHFLYTSLNEIDQFDALRGQGNQQFRIMCLAFDPGNQYGQTRVGTQSVTERVCVRFNWNASTTIHKGQKYFARVLTDGPISRINFCTIPEREIGADMPVYGTYDEGFGEQLQPYIDNLCRASGRIECHEAYQLALKLKEENADFARMSQSRIYENLSFRANVIAYLKACVLYVANGCQWEEGMDEFIRWSERYDLWCKMRFFADAIAKSEDEGVKSSNRGPANLLQLLPDTFTTNDVKMLREKYGLSGKGTNSMLTTWVYRHYIEKDGDDCHSHSCHSFVKLKFRRDGVDIVR